MASSLVLFLFRYGAENFSNISSDISALGVHGSTSLDVNEANGIWLCIFLVRCHSSDSHFANQPVDYCECLVCVASLLAALAPSLAFLCIDWVRYSHCENLDMVLFADLH